MVGFVLSFLVSRLCKPRNSVAVGDGRLLVARLTV
jgi:hypothetical protein